MYLELNTSAAQWVPFLQDTTTYVHPAFHFISLLMFDRTTEMKKPSTRQRAVNDCFIIFKFFSWILMSLPQFTEGIWHSDNASNVFRPLSKACQTEGARSQVTCRIVYQILFLLLCHSQTRKMFKSIQSPRGSKTRVTKSPVKLLEMEVLTTWQSCWYPLQSSEIHSATLLNLRGKGSLLVLFFAPFTFR